MRIAIAILLLIPVLSIAQDGNYSLGGRHFAMSGASVTLSDEWAVFNNVGALGASQRTAALISYRNRYDIQGFHIRGAAITHSNKYFNSGVKFYKFGDDLFNQQILGLAIANKIQMVSIGGGINFIQTHVEGFADKRITALELGGIAELTSQFVLGAHIFNFKHGQQHPTTMKAGLSFRPRDFLMINTEIEKQLNARELFKAGLEYVVIPNVILRTGINIQGNEVDKSNTGGTFGLGLFFVGFAFDYAFTSEDLGDIHEISLSYRIVGAQ
ncbi:MAG: hypothetical protein JXR10_13460 [Cyclobacteriaceae bacterium]